MYLRYVTLFHDSFLPSTGRFLLRGLLHPGFHIDPLPEPARPLSGLTKLHPALLEPRFGKAEFGGLGALVVHRKAGVQTEAAADNADFFLML